MEDQVADRDTFGAKESLGTTKLSRVEAMICRDGIHKVLEEIVAFCPTITKVKENHPDTVERWQDIQDTVNDLLTRIDGLRPKVGEKGLYEENGS